VLVTVGSTLFPSLTNTILSPPVLDILSTSGVERLFVQYGRAELVIPETVRLGHVKPFREGGENGDTGMDVGMEGFQWDGMKVVMFRFSENFEGLIKGCDGVISHAGSGSILAVLRADPPKPLLAVPNTSLMDNHQAQLADALDKEGYLVVSTVEDLEDKLRTFLDPQRVKAITPFPAFDGTRFRRVMDEMMGYEDDEL